MNQNLSTEAVRCVLLADRHHGLSEGIRGLLESEFPAVVMVADETSLLATAANLRPSLVVADLALAHGQGFGWLRRLLARCPGSKVIVLSSHEEAIVGQQALEAGAMGYLRRREIATDLLPAVDTVMAGGRYASPGNLPQETSGIGEPKKSP